MRKLRSLVLATLAATVLAVAGCGGDDDSGGGEGGGEPVKIGASLPLTGEFSEPGKAAKQGYEVWEAMVNESGGLIDGRNVEMVIKDDASNQNTIVADYNALISRDKVDLLLGTFSSLLNLPASAVAQGMNSARAVDCGEEVCRLAAVSGRLRPVDVELHTAGWRACLAVRST